MSEQWEEVVVPRGTYIGWGRIGQQVTGEVINYSPDGGTDYNDQPCPELVLVLTSPSETWTKKGTVKTDLEAGEFVTITAGLANLKSNIKSAHPEPGMVVRITYTADERSDKGNDVKVFAMAKAPIRPRAPRPSADALV